MASKIAVNLDTSKENHFVDKCKQNDDLTLEAFIYENGEPLDLTNKEITIQALKADNTYVIQNTDIVKEENKINSNLVRDFSRVPGTTKIEVVLTESSKQNTTFSFYLEVVGSVIRGAVESGDKVTILEKLQDKIVEAGAVKDETEELINSGGAATKGDIQEVNTHLEEKAHKTFVTYSEFGAMLDGITDDRQSIINCHKYANEYNLNVVQNGGKVLCNFTVEVKTSCNLNVDFIINDSTPYTVYNIISDTEKPDYQYEGSFSTDQINNFIDFKGKFFVPRLDNDTWKLGKRSTEPSGTEYYHRQPVVIDNNGTLISSPIYLGNTGSFTIKYCKDISEKGVTFSGGRVITNLTKVGFPRLVKCSRNNCIIKNMTIYNANLPSSKENYSTGLINVVGCANITIKNINGLNNSLDVTTAHSYVLDFTDTYNVIIENCNLTQGWGSSASHFCDTIIVNNTIINRFDNHYGAFGRYSLTSSTLSGIGTVCCGYGNANFIIDNVTFNNTYQTSYVFYTRNDFNITFSGTLSLSNIRFQNEVFTRIINYQIGTGNANTNLSKGKINIVADNIITTKALILNSTDNIIAIKIYNCEIVPCTSNGFCSVDAYSSKLRTVITTSTTRLYSCEIISFGSSFNSTLYLYSCYVYPDINNTDINLYASNCQIANINNSNKAYLISCFATSLKTVTAITTKSLTGCLNIT